MQNKSPSLAYFEITQACNLSCEHCINDTRFGGDSHSESSLSSVADELSKLDISNLVITGGEVFLRKRQLYEILGKFRDDGVKTSINTNLTRVTVDDARRLKELGIEGILTSLNGHSSNTHDDITNCSGAFDQTIEGIDIVVKEGIHIGVNMVGTNRTKDNVYKTGKLAKELGADFFSVTPIIANPFCFSEHMSKSLSPDNLLTLMWDLYAVKQDFGLETQLLRVIPYCFFWDHKELRELAKVGCGVGNHLINVRSNGDITGCIALNQTYGNLLNDNFNKIWQLAIDSKDQPFETCNECDIVDLCNGGCKAENQSYRLLGINNPLIKSPIILDDRSKHAVVEQGIKFCTCYGSPGPHPPSCSMYMAGEHTNE